MPRKAIVRTEDGHVENVVVADDDFNPGDGRELINADDRPVSPGDIYDDASGDFIAAEDPAPRPTLQERVERLEEATGVGGKSADRGIASRLDDIEDRLSALESKVG